MRSRAHRYEERWFRGALRWASKLADTPVYYARREFRLSAFCVYRLSRKVSADPPTGEKLSVSRDTDRGAEPTIEVGFGPRYLDPKLSESLFNRPAPVYNAVGFGGRMQPYRPCFRLSQEYGPLFVCVTDRMRFRDNCRSRSDSLTAVGSSVLIRLPIEPQSMNVRRIDRKPRRSVVGIALKLRYSAAVGRDRAPVAIPVY